MQPQSPPLKGRNDKGEFATSCAKIYPPSMNEARALSFTRFLDSRSLSAGTSLPSCLQELNSADFVSKSTVQKDYHSWSTIAKVHDPSMTHAATAKWQKWHIYIYTQIHWHILTYRMWLCTLCTCSTQRPVRWSAVSKLPSWTYDLHDLHFSEDNTAAERKKLK